MADPEKLEQEIRPLGFAAAAAYFGLPALLMVFTLYIGEPFLIAQGVPVFFGSSLALYGPLALLLAAALAAYRLEGRRMTWPGLAERFRFRRMDGADWGWALALAVWASFVLLNPLSKILVENGVIPLPARLPALLDPGIARDPGGAGAALSGGMPGWTFAGLNLVFLLVNVFGEELWWRGYILPRQEAAHGRWAWVIHGVMWTLFHAPKYWEYLTLLPGCLAYAYVSQRTRNTWPAVIAHLLVNGAGMAAVVLPALQGG